MERFDSVEALLSQMAQDVEQLPPGPVLDRPLLTRAVARPAGARGPLPWARTDWGLAIAGLGLSLLGALLVWSSTRHQSGTAYLARHLVNTGIGMALAALVTRVDFRVLRAWAPWVYLVSVLGLVLVLSPVGSTINGSHSWIQLPGGFSVQPSEMAKIALCVGLAVILAERRERGAPPTSRDLLLAVVVAAVPIGLVCSSRTSARPWCSERSRSAWSASRARPGAGSPAPSRWSWPRSPWR